MTLKLHASLHPALHTVPAALRMHHPAGGGGAPPFLISAEAQRKRQAVTVSVQLSVIYTGSTSLLFADEEVQAWLQVCAGSLTRRMPHAVLSGVP